jgi:anti-sigma-K factor RskA
MAEKHAIFKENLAAYALGALDLGNVTALRAHLRTCDSCRAELAYFERISTGLLSALPPQAPRAALKQNLRTRLSHESGFNLRSFKWSLNQFALASALALLLGLSVFSVFEGRAVQQAVREQDDRNRSEQTAIAMLAYPATQVTAFEQNGITGSLLIDKKRNLLAVFAWHLPIPPPGKTYQMWLIDQQGDRTSGGFLMPETSYPFVMAVINSPAPLIEIKGLGVTLEPLGGSPAPTGPKILGVDF